MAAGDSIALCRGISSMKQIMHWVSLLIKNGFIILGGWWTLIQILNNQHIDVPPVIAAPWNVLYVTIFCTIAIYFLPLFSVLRMHNSDRELCIRPGNILRKRNSSIVIGINDTLSCDLNDIGEHSIHHQLLKLDVDDKIKQCFNDQKTSDKQTAASEQNASGETKKWKYGYLFTCDVSRKNQSFVFLVMSSLHKPGTVLTNPRDLQKSITQLFQSENDYVIKRGHLVIPLIGTGSAGVEMTKHDVIKMIACTYCSRTPGDCHGITRLTIKIQWRDYLKMNIHSIIKELKWIAENCCCLYNE